MSKELQQAIALIKSGDKRAGRQLLARVLREQPHNTTAWLWMSGVVSTDEQRRDCLEHVLALDPGNEFARRGLDKLSQRPLPASDPAEKPPALSQRTDPPVQRNAPAKPTPRLSRFVLVAGIIIVACVGIAGVSYAALRVLGRQVLQADPFTGGADVSATVQIGADLPAPALPTATPPGEEIVDPNYLAGKIAYDKEDYQEVLRRMALVLEADPDLAPAHWYRGMAYYYTDNYEAGLAEMEKALSIDRRYALGYADRGLLHSALGHRRQAMADWEKALSLDPTLAKTHHNIAVAHYKDGDYAQAMDEYNAALEIDPNRAATWAARGEALQEMGYYQECIDSIERSMVLDPSMWPNYYDRAACRAGLEQYAAAIEDLDVYVQADPTCPQGWYTRGYCNQYLDQHQQAVSDYTQALKLNPSFTWAWINRGLVYVEIKEYGLALDDFDEALSFGEIPMAHYGRGEAYRGLAQLDQAVDSYEKAARLSPGWAAPHGRLGGVYFDLERYEDAVRALDKAVMLDPDCPCAYDLVRLRAHANYAADNHERAVQDFSQVIEGQPSVWDFYYRGIAYQANGQKEEAIADLEQFINYRTGDEAKVEDANERLAQLRQ